MPKYCRFSYGTNTLGIEAADVASPGFGLQQTLMDFANVRNRGLQTTYTGRRISHATGRNIWHVSSHLYTKKKVEKK
eukprot:scaffold6322_cov59-Cylindrotheca_fusiformis.AAC.7